MSQKALIDPQLDLVVRDLKDQKEQTYRNRTNNDAVPWLRPPSSEWLGDLQTEEALKAIARAFNTDEAEGALIDAFNPKDPGNSADGIVLTLQIDYMAQMERAFRARHSQNFHRALAHFSTREKGHGQDTGALVGQALEYFNHIIKQGSEGSGGTV